uniref:Uncharacterized protein n=1 Tax=Arundo donax TaxID=35708 RepID=A0A0A9CFJ3_ARUDO
MYLAFDLIWNQISDFNISHWIPLLPQRNQFDQTDRNQYL